MLENGLNKPNFFLLAAAKSGMTPPNQVLRKFDTIPTPLMSSKTRNDLSEKYSHDLTLLFDITGINFTQNTNYNSGEQK